MLHGDGWVCWTSEELLNKLWNYCVLLHLFHEGVSKVTCVCVCVCRIKPHCEVSNALKKWHIAYHGSSVGALRRTLDHNQLLSGEIPAEKQNKSLSLQEVKDPSLLDLVELFKSSNIAPPTGEVLLQFDMFDTARNVVDLLCVPGEDGRSERLQWARREQRPRQGGTQSATLSYHALLWSRNLCSQSAVSIVLWDDYFPVKGAQETLIFFSPYPADFGIHVLTAPTRPRLDSRSVCVQAPIRWDPRLWGTASL